MQTPVDHAAGEDDVLFLAGHTAPAGTYRLLGTDREIRLNDEDILPATCDGRIAAYKRRALTWADLQYAKK